MKSEKKLKHLPLGESTFRDIINKDKLYVDKTEEIYKLLETHGKYFFLSRPRRFGKSLLVSTLESIFNGEKELFKDLYIYDKIDFKKYPIIKIDFNHVDMSTPEKLDYHLNLQLDKISDSYNIVFKKAIDYKSKFDELTFELAKISEQKKVVILIDEYDKPIIEHISNIEIAKKNRDILKNFYETIKANDEYIHFAFLTGVSKFSKTSIFSSLNNLTDITMYENYSKIVGITEEELYSNFEEYIEELCKKNNFTIEKIKMILKDWYNGYSWDGMHFLYNPYSLLSVFDSGKIKNYWFKTGTPTFLIKLIKDFNLNLKKLEKIILNEEDFETYELENMNIYALLFQTGYLTIKEVLTSDIESEYMLSYPNKEVKDSMLNNLLDDYAYQQISDDISINEMIRKLRSNDLDGLINIFKSIFGTIAVKMQPDKKVTLYERELYYHTIFYLIFRLIGSKIKAEVSTSKGFIDAVAETNTHVYIFEFKMTNPEVVVDQIREKKYYESYLATNKEIVLVGVSFDSENKNIKDFLVSGV